MGERSQRSVAIAGGVTAVAWGLALLVAWPEGGVGPSAAGPAVAVGLEDDPWAEPVAPYGTVPFPWEDGGEPTEPAESLGPEPAPELKEFGPGG